MQSDAIWARKHFFVTRFGRGRFREANLVVLCSGDFNLRATLTRDTPTFRTSGWAGRALMAGRWRRQSDSATTEVSATFRWALEASVRTDGPNLGNSNTVRVNSGRCTRRD